MLTDEGILLPVTHEVLGVFSVPATDGYGCISFDAAVVVTNGDLALAVHGHGAHEAVQSGDMCTVGFVLRCETALLAYAPARIVVPQLVPSQSRQGTAADIHGVVRHDRLVATEIPVEGLVHEPAVDHIIADTLGGRCAIAGIAHIAFIGGDGE